MFVKTFFVYYAIRIYNQDLLGICDPLCLNFCKIGKKRRESCSLSSPERLAFQIALYSPKKSFAGKISLTEKGFILVVLLCTNFYP